MRQPVPNPLSDHLEGVAVAGALQQPLADLEIQHCHYIPGCDLALLVDGDLVPGVGGRYLLAVALCGQEWVPG